MKLSQAANYAIRFTLQQSVPASRKHGNGLVYPAALLLASVGVAVSSFSVKQLLATATRRF